MIWYEKLYVSEGLEPRVNKIKWNVLHNAGQINIYLITLPSNTSNLLDIIPSWELMQKSYPKRKMVVVGVAKGYSTALELAAVIVNETYRKTGSFDVRQYLLTRIRKEAT